MPKMPKRPRPPRLRSRIPTAPTGPEVYRRGVAPTLGAQSFITPPEDFITAHTSLPEWMIYLALAIKTGQPKDPFQPPFIGGPPIWVYQKEEEGGRVPGGSVSDFVVLNLNGTAQIGIRVETERYHIWTDAKQQQKDLYILSHLKTVNKIVRIWDQHFIDDPTGEKACEVVALALKGIELPSPIRLGTAQRTRL